MPDEIDELIRQADKARLSRQLGEAKVALEDASSRIKRDPTDARGIIVLRELAEVERKLGDRTSARKHYDEAVQQLRSQNDALRLAHAVRHLGDVHHELGQSDMADICYHEALALYRCSPEVPKLDLANAIRSMAVLKEELGAAGEATALWEEARALYLALGVEAGVNESTRRLALLSKQ